MSAHELKFLSWSASSQTLKEKALEEAIIRWCDTRDIRYEYGLEQHPNSSDTSSLIVHISAKGSEKLLDYLKALQAKDLPE